MRGWYFQSHRHSLAAQGIKTSLRAKKLNMAQGFFTQAYTSGARKGAEKFEQKYKLPTKIGYVKATDLPQSKLTPEQFERVKEIVSRIVGDENPNMVAELVAKLGDPNIRDFDAEQIRKKLVSGGYSQDAIDKIFETGAEVRKENMKQSEKDEANKKEVARIQAGVNVVNADESEQVNPSLASVVEPDYGELRVDNLAAKKLNMQQMRVFDERGEMTDEFLQHVKDVQKEKEVERRVRDEMERENEIQMYKEVMAEREKERAVLKPLDFSHSRYFRKADRNGFVVEPGKNEAKFEVLVEPEVEE